MALTMQDAKVIRDILGLALVREAAGRSLVIRGNAVADKIEREAQGRKNIAHMSREEREEDLVFSPAARKHGERVEARRRANNYVY